MFSDYETSLWWCDDFGRASEIIRTPPLRIDPSRLTESLMSFFEHFGGMPIYLHTD